ALVLQIDRIEIEWQMQEQRRTRQYNADCAGNDWNAAALQDIIDRRQYREADRRGFTARFEDGEHRRHQRNAAGKGDQHAAAGNEAELRKAAIAGREKREEAHRSSGSGECERIAGFLRRPPQRPRQVALLVTLGAVAYTELDAEIDAQPDEQHEECNRDQIER